MKDTTPQQKKEERKVLVTYPDGELKEGFVIEETENYIHARLGGKQSVINQWLSRSQCEELTPISS